MRSPGLKCWRFAIGPILGARDTSALWRRHLGQALTEADYDQAAGSVAWWQQEQRQRGWRVELLLETHDAFSASGPCCELLARLREPVGIIWDTHHTWRLGGESPSESWSHLSKWIRHVHVKDSITNPPHGIHIHMFCRAMAKCLWAKSSSYWASIICRVVSLEWERLWHPLPPAVARGLGAIADAAVYLAFCEVCQ